LFEQDPGSSYLFFIMGDGSFKMSKIEVIVNRPSPEEVEEQGPREVPMFDQTMSILVMIKEKKVNLRN
jgi:hypothetical protein